MLIMAFLKVLDKLMKETLLFLAEQMFRFWVVTIP